MAVVTTKKGAGVTFIVEMSEAEAQYVFEALRKSCPARDLGGGEGSDTVWVALDEAMTDARVPPDAGALLGS